MQQLVEEVLDGLTSDQLRWQPAPGANPVGWLVWHLSRVQDSQVSEVAGAQQVWLADGWAPRLGLPYDPAATGYGQRAEGAGASQPAGHPERAAAAPAMSAAPAAGGLSAQDAPSTADSASAEAAPQSDAISADAPIWETVSAGSAGRSNRDTAASLGAWQRGSRSGRDSARRGRHEERDG